MTDNNNSQNTSPQEAPPDTFKRIATAFLPPRLEQMGAQMIDHIRQAVRVAAMHGLFKNSKDALEMRRIIIDHNPEHESMPLGARLMDSEMQKARHIQAQLEAQGVGRMMRAIFTVSAITEAMVTLYKEMPGAFSHNPSPLAPPPPSSPNA